MRRIKKLSARVVLSITLAFSVVTPAQVALLGVGTTAAATSIACKKGTLSKLHDALNKTAKSLDAAIETNGSLYAAGTYGLVGSPQAIEMRQRVARVIHDSNENLIIALNLAKGLTEATFEQGKLGVLQALANAAKGLSVGQQTVDLVLATVSTLISQAVALIQLFQSNDVQHMERLIPVIDNHLKEFGRIQEASA